VEIMVKLKYDGDIKKSRVKVFNSIFFVNKGDIIDVSEKEASKLLKDNKNFTRVNGSTKKLVGKKKVKFDLDKDGDFDKDDLSLAGKALAHARKKIIKK